jgi:class 3 adenylate cyclase/pimeloyl-ACP methyl ester carboxylesterase
MEPRIQYARTSDGVSIAYWSLGEGEPLVYMPNIIWSHAQREWQFPEIRRWYEALVEGRTLVRFDARGTGLSQRTVEDYSLGALELDLQAVVDELGLERFAIFASINAVQVAVAYAAHNPERVSHLIIFSYAPNADIENSRYASLLALQQVMERDWETYTETRAGIEFGWTEGDLAHRYAGFLRECITPHMATRAYGAVGGFDMSPLLHNVAAPTLILHRQQLYFWGVEASQELAAQIPGANLALLEGTSTAPFYGDSESVLAAIDGFIGHDSQPKVIAGRDISGTTSPPETGTAIILFLDVAGSTELTTKLGDAAYREKERALDESLRAAIREVGGLPVEGKVLGDGVMATFASAKDAIDAGLTCQSLGASAELPLHAGIHAGDVLREDNNVHGGAVQVAARIADASAAGEVLVSDIVRGLARTSAGVSFEDHGERELKGVSEPVRVFAVRSE